jgi:hypothetical protein
MKNILMEYRNECENVFTREDAEYISGQKRNVITEKIGSLT